ncbi:AMP-dependent synthetase/ligase [Ramlibacter rhizophilus]|uniref:Long-chain fatty acid--CoA ligase n=1 Tax=Ramlibacter rhizophilus TaxID=1781167 RepID=A0A4Z0BSB6_9BURK|nr:AMP-binding protein [Ramlibacter rhizophilus]TFZ01354.1 long-chain fatty acid--CoA ligase [Ramlibacter rhizophilus]
MNRDADSTFPQRLLHHATHQPQRAAIREKEYGIWQTLGWQDLATLVEHLACGLHRAGFAAGEHLVLVGANRPRLYAMMLAAQALGGIAVPLYQDAAAAECVFPITNANIRFAFAEDQEQVDKLLEIRPQCPQLAHIYYDDPRGLRNYRAPGLVSVDQLVADGAEAASREPGFFRAKVEAGRPDDVAAMFFTSGTTGQPKGVVHTHRTLLDRAFAGAEFDRLTEREEVLAYMPPAWVGQNIFSYAQWLACGYVVNCPESAATVNIDLKEIGPTYYFAPPRIFEGMLTSVMIRMEDAGAIKRGMFHAFMKLARRVGPRLRDGQPVGLLDRIGYALGDVLVYGPLRNNLGFSRVRVAYTAGEAIGPDLFSFYRAIGINLKQLYGSTETAVFVCMQPDHQVKADTVGVPCRGVEIRVEDGGEILVRSPGLLREYYRNEAATREVKTEDGWYRTGDAGFLDAQGHLKIIDRAKDVGRLAGGAMFAPKYIENKLKFFPHIKEAVAVGDGRDRVCAMINIDFEAVGNWAERRNLPYAGYTDLAGKPQVLELVRECVEQVNADLAADERLCDSQIHRFLVLHKELDADDGELTRTNKVRRGHVAEKYKVLVDALYAGLPEQFIETQVKFEDGRTGTVSATLKIVDARTFAPVKAAA